jgi:hypothetical protein
MNAYTLTVHLFGLKRFGRTPYRKKGTCVNQRDILALDHLTAWRKGHPFKIELALRLREQTTATP